MTVDIKLPPLPASEEVTRKLENAFPWVEVHILMVDYARAAIKADRQQRGEPVAYAVFADNGNIRIWQHEPLDWPEAVPLYPATQSAEPVELDRYDAGLFGGQDGMPAYVWHDIIRAELDRAYDFYMDQLDRAAPQPAAPAQEPSDEDIGRLAAEHLSAHAQFVGAGEVHYEGEIEFARALLARYGNHHIEQPTTPKGWKPVPVEPDTALLVSMATCLYHGFGLLDERSQDSMLHDMRKLHEEVLGKGYYSPENRARYLSMLDAAPKFGEEE